LPQVHTALDSREVRDDGDDEGNRTGSATGWMSCAAADSAVSAVDRTVPPRRCGVHGGWALLGLGSAAQAVGRPRTGPACLASWHAL
jgi:hypothetical protein